MNNINIFSDIHDDIDKLLEKTYNELLLKFPDFNLSNITNEIESGKSKVEILLGGNYKNIDTQNNRLSLGITDDGIELKEIVSDGKGDIYMFLLIKYSIDNDVNIDLKAERFLEKGIVSNEEYEKINNKLIGFYNSFLFKSKDKSIKNNLNFNFDNFNDNELVIFHKRLKIFNELGKWPRL